MLASGPLNAAGQRAMRSGIRSRLCSCLAINNSPSSIPAFLALPRPPLSEPSGGMLNRALGDCARSRIRGRAAKLPATWNSRLRSSWHPHADMLHCACQTLLRLGRTMVGSTPPGIGRPLRDAPLHRSAQPGGRCTHRSDIGSSRLGGPSALGVLRRHDALHRVRHSNPARRVHPDRLRAASHQACDGASGIRLGLVYDLHCAPPHGPALPAALCLVSSRPRWPTYWNASTSCSPPRRLLAGSIGAACGASPASSSNARASSATASLNVPRSMMGKDVGVVSAA